MYPSAIKPITTLLNNGSHDSNVDILLHSSTLETPETVIKIICKFSNPLVLSHHDVIISEISLPYCPAIQTVDDSLVTAPRMDITRLRISWTEEGIAAYTRQVAPLLQRLRKTWLHPDSPSSMSILLKMTNSIMSATASFTNPYKVLKIHQPKSRRIPKEIRCARNHLLRLHKARNHRHGQDSTELLAAHRAAKQKYKQVVRAFRVKAGKERDEKLFNILETTPRSIFKYIKNCRRSDHSHIDSLTVGSKTYIGASVPDGFYDSMSSIKSCNLENLKDNPDIAQHLSNHSHILKLCNAKQTIPPIDLDTSTALLHRMKKNVSDIYSITALHYSNAGTEGLAHFNCLLNGLLSDVNNASIEEMNLALGLIHHKGHGKPKTSDRSYRTISTCPFMAKAADLYLRDLFRSHWDSCQAETQYQGSGSSHELAALLVTEVIQFSLNVARMPVFLLSLDAQSAFDRCLRQILTSQLYKAGINGTALHFINNRLTNRSTVYQWEGTMMGPAHDDTGFEQGGINSSEFYKLYNNNQLVSSQRSRLGIDMKSSVISAIGQADDVVHVANSIDDLNLLVKITENYCNRFRVTLVPSKTKLLVFGNKEHKFQADLARLMNPIRIADVPVSFSDEAEHVGIIRHTSGNLPNLLQRISSHKKSLGAILSAGLARGHRGNPAASLRVHQLYQTPVLFSGLAALCLTKAEVKILDSHYQNTLQNIQRLHDRTPRAVVCFMAGSLPGEAILHTRQLTLFSMITRLHGDPLHKHALYALTCLPRSANSWFLHIRDICLMYSLPHPLELLQYPLSRLRFKSLVEKRVISFWEDTLRSETLDLTSLMFFDAANHSLQKPSLIWQTSGSSSYECAKSHVLARMQSGRYRSDYMCRHWTPSNKMGYCLSSTCAMVKGDLVHMLTTCPALHQTRAKLVSFWLAKTLPYPPLNSLIIHILSSPPNTQAQFIVNPCSLTAVTDLYRSLGDRILTHIYYLVRTFAYYMHRAKMLSLGRWHGDPGRKPRTVTHKPSGCKSRGQTLPHTKTVKINNNNSHFYVAGSTVISLTRTESTYTPDNPASMNGSRTHLSQHQRQHCELSDSASKTNTTLHLGQSATSGAAADHASNTNQGMDTGPVVGLAGLCIGGQ